MPPDNRLSPDRLAELRERAESTVAPFRELYPFEHHFLGVEGGALHYVDEGPRDAPVLLCLHGNPTWSFYWRALVAAFAGEMRVIAPDHLGCGLSDKPQDWPYTLVAHMQNVERLIEALELDAITLAVHDWGGPIGMGAATRHARRFARLVVMNTAAFLSPDLPTSIAAARLPVVGPLLVRGLNSFARGATRKTTTSRLSRDVRRAYLAPYDSWANRVALQGFVDDIPMHPSHPSYVALSDIDVSLDQLVHLPTCILWGEKDWVFTPDFRKMWESRFPDAEVYPFESAGHWLLEDAGDEVVGRLRTFFHTHPVASGAPA